MLIINIFSRPRENNVKRNNVVFNLVLHAFTPNPEAAVKVSSNRKPLQNLEV